MKKIVFATNNKNKIREVREILDNQIEILSLEEIDCHEDIPETSDTIEGNSKQKATYIADKYHVDCFADDTGLEIEALNGAPGVYSARYAGLEKGAGHNRRKVLDEMKDKENRKARFRTAIYLIRNGKHHLFEGIINGSITYAERGLGGFGYDSIFVPEGYDKTFAELGDDVKNKISHRAIAIQKLVKFLLNN